MGGRREKRIEDYALIGDGETAALIGRDATIEWLCMPRFDSEACFTALLGDEENGCWKMAPVGEVRRTSRRYIDDTLVLETLFETDEGVVAVIDFMPRRGQAPDIVRIVEGRAGEVAMHTALAIRFDYGQIHPHVRRCSEHEVLAIAGPDGISLQFDTEIAFRDRWFVSDFTVAAGERRAFLMTWYSSHGEVPAHVDAEDALEETCRYWRDWTSSCDYRGPYRREVVRSLITLKAMIHEPTGGMVAAPTASLPECPGGERNWDYRYCWLRDSTLTLLAFLQGGMQQEADAWMRWLRHAVAGEPIDLRPFYTVSGERRIHEWEAPWLAGFNGARPVRFGNAAADQLQLDVYGEVLDALHAAAEHGLERNGDSHALVDLLVREAEENWERPDAGIWESRSKPRHYVYSKVMCWVAFDRAAHWYARSDAARAEHCRALARRVKAQVIERGFDAERDCFTGAYGHPDLDAALLRLPLVGFLPTDDPRMAGTVRQIERRLMQDGMVRRYETERFDDGVGGPEGTFMAAGFWLVDVHVLQGRVDEARLLFERLCAHANDLGLLAEEVDDGRLLGNFPQALSHLSLVASAENLSRTGGPVHERSRARE